MSREYDDARAAIEGELKEMVDDMKFSAGWKGACDRILGPGGTVDQLVAERLLAERRDRFASAALTGLLSIPEDGSTPPGCDGTMAWWFKHFATLAFWYADAMLEASDSLPVAPTVEAEIAEGGGA